MGRFLSLFLMGIVLVGGMARDVPAAERENLVVITSFPRALFEPFEAAFEVRYPDINVRILNKKTSAAIVTIQERSSAQADIFWASAPDAFEVLKGTGHLQPYRPNADGIPDVIGKYPLNDPDGHYTGFAVSGYGIMWNESYLEKRGLPNPEDWKDLRKGEYFGHIGISAPSRSGTTHLIVESILQSQGWDKGWKTLLEIGGNLATVTARSYGVPRGVINGLFGVGLVIDFFGHTAKATGNPTSFSYPAHAVLVPASVAVLKDAPNPEAARKFVDFLLSDAGQALLFRPEISRMPVLERSYASSPPAYPNPFSGTLTKSLASFNSTLSQQRYHLVNALFDQMITFRLRDLNRAWSAIHKAEVVLKKKANQEFATQVIAARRLASTVPVSVSEAHGEAFSSLFMRRQKGIPVSSEQVAHEEKWARIMTRNLEEAASLAEGVLASMGGDDGK